MTEAEMDALGNAFENDEWDADSFEKVFVGRPSLGEGETKTMTFKIPASMLFRVESRASDLGVTRSQYLRDLIDRDLSIA